MQENQCKPMTWTRKPQNKQRWPLLGWKGRRCCRWHRNRRKEEGGISKDARVRRVEARWEKRSGEERQRDGRKGEARQGEGRGGQRSGEEIGGKEWREKKRRGKERREKEVRDVSHVPTTAHFSIQTKAHMTATQHEKTTAVASFNASFNLQNSTKQNRCQNQSPQPCTTVYKKLRRRG